MRRKKALADGPPGLEAGRLRGGILPAPPRVLLPALLALALLALAAPARPGDIRGRLDLAHQARPGAVRLIRAPADSSRLIPPVIVFLRGNGMVTTRRGGPAVSVIRMKDQGRDPTPLVARLGDTLRVVNDTAEPRPIFLFQGAVTRTWTLAAGASIATGLDRFGPVELYSAEPGRGSAWLLVVENPFYREAGPGGRFLLDGVTPGRYDVCAWQPGRAMACATADVPLEGEVAVRITLR